MATMSSASIRPSPNALQLGREMLSMDEVMREILDETIPGDGSTKVHESGRTVCGPAMELVGPLARFPTSVQLAQCPRGVRGGTWHTHVTKQQLRTPTNSLPDTANVIFGEVDVSIVVGTKEAEMMVAAEDRDVALSEFQDALGLKVESTDQVIDAIVGGHVPNPPKARERVRSRLSSLFERRRTNFTDLESRLSDSGIPSSSPGMSIDFLEATRMQEVSHRHPHRGSKNPLRDPQGMREWARGVKAPVKEGASDDEVKRVARNSAISTVVGQVVSRLIP